MTTARIGKPAGGLDDGSVKDMGSPNAAAASGWVRRAFDPATFTIVAGLYRAAGPRRRRAKNSNGVRLGLQDT